MIPKTNLRATSSYLSGRRPANRSAPNFLGIGTTISCFQLRGMIFIAINAEKIVSTIFVKMSGASLSKEDPVPEPPGELVILACFFK